MQQGPYPYQPYQPYQPYAQVPPPQDANHLQLLSIFHYIVGGLVGLFGCVFIIYIVIGAVFVADPPTGSPGSPAPPAAFGLIFVAIGSLAVAISWTLAGCLVASGICLSRRRRWVFCLVVACVSCMWMPWGTALGVFTLIVLNRASVKALFANNAAQ